MVIKKDNLEKLLALDGKEFVKEAYREVLLREADPRGLENYVCALEHNMLKERILFELRFSEEGLKKEVAFTDFELHEIEISRLLSFEEKSFIEAAYAAILGRMPDEGGKKFYLDNINTGVMNKVNVLCALRFSEEGRKVKTAIKGLNFVRRRQKVKELIFRAPIIGCLIKKLSRLMKANQRANVYMGHAEQHLLHAEQRMNKIQCQIDGLVLDKIKQQNIIKRVTGDSYKNYEDVMRGSRQEIKEKLNIYEAIINKVKANNGEKLFALDLGCGRGEWLELMEKSYHITAFGVDSDQSMLSDCEKFELNTINADLFDYIKNAESNSADLITMFQVAEHLPIRLLIDVLIESFRVLRRGGALIVETPNSENVIIGACNFYFDPTHITKLPPMLLKILVEDAGMSDVEIVRMHRYNAIEVEKISQDSAEGKAIRQMAGFFNNYADYAVTAFKK